MKKVYVIATGVDRTVGKYPECDFNKWQQHIRKESQKLAVKK